MFRNVSPLDNVNVASPCSADWAGMYGNDRRRFCGDCKLNVYNLSGMSREEAEELLTRAEGRLCVRFYRRADGTILTQDCPVGWARVKQRISVTATAALSIFLSAFGGGFLASMFAKSTPVMGEMLPIPVATPTPRYEPDNEPLMGVMAIPTPRPVPKGRKVRIEVMGDADPGRQ